MDFNLRIPDDNEAPIGLNLNINPGGQPDDTVPNLDLTLKPAADNDATVDITLALLTPSSSSTNQVPTTTPSYLIKSTPLVSTSGGCGVFRDVAGNVTPAIPGSFVDTNNYVTGITFVNGVLTLNRLGLPDLTANLDGRYLTSYTEHDPVYSASVAAGISLSDISRWNSAYGWGDHSLAGYLKSYTETDPTVPAWVKTILEAQITQWNTAYLWGNHADAGYLKSETDPTVPAWVKAITASQISNWSAAYGWGNHALAGYLTSETDPVFTASAAHSITSTNITNWNAAYSWGNHAGLYVGLGRTLTINGVAQDLTADRTWTIPTPNFANADLTFFQDRTHDVGNYYLYINATPSLSDFQFSSDYTELYIQPASGQGYGMFQIYCTPTYGDIYMFAGIGSTQAVWEIRGEAGVFSSLNGTADIIQFNTPSLKLYQALPTGASSDAVLVRSSTGQIKAVTQASIAPMWTAIPGIPNGGNFIYNQYAGPQASANLWIDGYVRGNNAYFADSGYFGGGITILTTNNYEIMFTGTMGANIAANATDLYLSTLATGTKVYLGGNGVYNQVMIGDSTYTLDVNGSSRISSSAAEVFRLTSSYGANTDTVTFAKDYWGGYNVNAGYQLSFITNSATRFYVGTTQVAAIGGTYTLDVNGNTRISGTLSLSGSAGTSIQNYMGGSVATTFESDGYYALAIYDYDPDATDYVFRVNRVTGNLYVKGMTQETTDPDKMLVNSSGNIRYMTKAQLGLVTTAALAQPSEQVVYGTGTGVTSSSYLKFTYNLFGDASNVLLNYNPGGNAHVAAKSTNGQIAMSWYNSAGTGTIGIIGDGGLVFSSIQSGNGNGMFRWVSGGATTELMRLTGLGSLLLGTTTPVSIGSGITSITINGGSGLVGGGGVTFAVDNVVKGYVYTFAQDLNIQTTSGAVILTTAGAERARITAGGNLLVGTTTDPGYTLYVAGTSVGFASSTTQEVLVYGNTYSALYVQNSVAKWTFDAKATSGNLGIGKYANGSSIIIDATSLNVGIGGAPASSYVLDVNGLTRINSGLETYGNIYTQASMVRVTWTYGGGELRLWTDSANNKFGLNYGGAWMIYSVPAGHTYIGTYSDSYSVFIGAPSKQLTVAATGYVTVASLATGLTAPVTTGTTKMVVSDANGLLSFATMPVSAVASANQVVIGTGTGITSSSQFTYNGTYVGINAASQLAGEMLSVQKTTSGPAILGYRGGSQSTDAAFGVWGYRKIDSGSGYSGGQVVSGNYGQLEISPGGAYAFTSPKKVNISGATGIISTSDATGNITNSLGMLSGGAFYLLVGGSGSIDKVAAIRAMYPIQNAGSATYSGTIANYYGLYIDPIGAELPSAVTNRYGIYQEGANDQNFFAGFVKVNNDIEISDSTKGLILSAGGVRYRVTMTAGGGSLTITAI